MTPPDDFNKTLGYYMQRERENRGITIPGLSMLTGMSQKYIYELESGNRIVTVYDLFLIRNAFGNRN